MFSYHNASSEVVSDRQKSPTFVKQYSPRPSTSNVTVVVKKPSKKQRHIQDTLSVKQINPMVQSSRFDLISARKASKQSSAVDRAYCMDSKILPQNSSSTLLTVQNYCEDHKATAAVKDQKSPYVSSTDLL